MKTIELLNILEKNKESSIEGLLAIVPDLDFVSYIETMLEKKHITKGELILKSSLDRNYGYQILNGTKNPSQDKVILLALALELDLHDTNNLLTLSKNKILYPKIKRDALIILCISRHYSIFKTNELLVEYHYNMLK